MYISVVFGLVEATLPGTPCISSNLPWPYLWPSLHLWASHSSPGRCGGCFAACGGTLGCACCTGIALGGTERATRSAAGLGCTSSYGWNCQGLQGSTPLARAGLQLQSKTLVAGVPCCGSLTIFSSFGTVTTPSRRHPNVDLVVPKMSQDHFLLHLISSSPLKSPRQLVWRYTS